MRLPLEFIVTEMLGGGKYHITIFNSNEYEIKIKSPRW